MSTDWESSEASFWSDNNWTVNALERASDEVKRLNKINRALESKLVEGCNLVDMLATDIPDLAAWSLGIDGLLREIEDHED